MGLDAAVFKSKKHLPFDPEALGASFDPDTGEYFFEDDAMEEKYPPEVWVAVAKWLGNITSIGHLREELAEVLEDDSVVMSKVIYSGTHTGDFLPMNALPDLEWELSVIDEYLEERSSPLVAQFVGDMRELMSAAQLEGNPIVF
jgi:hypothetical protein